MLLVAGKRGKPSIESYQIGSIFYFSFYVSWARFLESLVLVVKKRKKSCVELQETLPLNFELKWAKIANRIFALCQLRRILVKCILFFEFLWCLLMLSGGVRNWDGFSSGTESSDNNFWWQISDEQIWMMMVETILLVVMDLSRGRTSHGCWSWKVEFQILNMCLMRRKFLNFVKTIWVCKLWGKDSETGKDV